MGYIKKQTLVGEKSNAEFGSAVSIYGEYCIVGEPEELMIYIYKKNTTGGWDKVFSATCIFPVFASVYGETVSLKGDYAIGGDNGFINNIGCVNFYRKVGENWEADSTFVLPSDWVSVPQFGKAVAIDYPYAAIGGIARNSFSGGLYVFKRVNDTWSELIIKTPKIGQEEGDYFGSAVSIDGDYIAVGAHRADNGTGKVYIYHKDEGGVDNWGQQASIEASDGEENDYFGYSVALSGNKLIVGAPYKKVGDDIHAGGVYVYERSGESWYEVKRIVESGENSYSNNKFGSCLDVDDNNLIVGSPGARGNFGVVGIFNEYENWDCEKITAIEDESSGFGCSVGISGYFVIIGASTANENPSFSDAGSAYVFEDYVPKLRLAQEFEVDQEYLPSKASVYLKRAGKNLFNYWALYSDRKNAIDASNFYTITQKTNKVIFDDRISDFTGNGYMVLAPELQLEIVENLDIDFSIINYPIRAIEPATFNFWIRCYMPAVVSPSAEPASITIDILLDGIMVKKIDTHIADAEWVWAGTTLPIPDSNEHILGIRLKDKGCAIDKLYLNVGDGEEPTLRDSTYTSVSYVTIHLKLYETVDTVYPEYPLFIYDYRTTIDKVVQDDWYNFDIKVLDDRMGYDEASYFDEKYFLVLSTSGSSPTNFVIWELINNENPEYISLYPSFMKT